LLPPRPSAPLKPATPLDTNLMLIRRANVASELGKVLQDEGHSCAGVHRQAQPVEPVEHRAVLGCDAVDVALHWLIQRTSVTSSPASSARRLNKRSRTRH
jgi:hypothetical protein